MNTSASTAAQGNAEGAAPRRKVNWIVLATAAFLVVGIAAAVFFAFRFVEDERQRDLQAWQIRLGIVADSRVASVSDWVEGKYATLRELAENASLQLYMTELEMAAGDKSQVTDQAAQAGYLRNLLVATAERTGFAAPPPSAEVAANVERTGIAGIGLVDAKGQPIVSSPGMPPITGKIREAVVKALGGQPALIDIFMGASNQPTIGFVLPIYGVQAEQGSAGIGAVVGIRLIGEDLFKRLQQPGETSKTSETYLVRLAGGTVEYLSPLADGTPPLKRSLAVDTPDLAAAFAIEKPGGFAIRHDYAGDEVLAVGRAVPDMPWTLVRKISRSEALAANETRLKTMLIVFVLIIVGVAITIIAVWRHGTSVRAAQAAEKFRISSERFENISKFMRVVTNSQPLGIVAVSGDTTYTFANEPAARDAGLKPEDLIGKTMASVIGPIEANAYARIHRDVLATFATAEQEGDPNSRERAKQSHLHEFGEGDDVKVIKSDHIPLRGDRDHPPAVLMVLNDITELTVEKRRSERMLGKLIDTLVGVVDRRNPFAVNMSSRVAEVARAIASEMDLPEADVKTVDTAGKLLGVGTIFVPTALLTKTQPLTPQEQRRIDTAYQVSAEILREVPFDGPVVDTIRQSGERWDGKGPLALQGEAILMTARVLAVASSFMVMISAGARAEAMTFDQATQRLLAYAGSRFDKRPVTALLHILQNRGGAARWAHFRQRPAKA